MSTLSVRGKEITIQVLVVIFLGLLSSFLAVYLYNFMQGITTMMKLVLMLFVPFFIALCMFFILKPRIFIYAILIALPFLPQYQRLVGANALEVGIFDLLPDVLFVMSMVLITIFAWTNSNGFAVKEERNMFLLLLGWTSLSLISTLFSWNIAKSFPIFIIGVLGPFLLYLILIRLTPTRKTLNELLLVLFGSYLMLIMLGILLNLRVMQTTNVTNIVQLRGGNIYGSNAVNETIAFLMVFIFVGWNYFSNNILLKICHISFVVLALGTILISLSRFGYVALFVCFCLAVGVDIIFKDKSAVKKYFLQFFAGGVGFLILNSKLNLLAFIMKRYTNGDSLSIQNIIEKAAQDGRMVIWQDALYSLKDNFMFGVGIGNHVEISPQGWYQAHNLFLNTAVEHGVLATCFLIAVIIYIVTINFKTRKEVTDPWLKRLIDFMNVGMFMFIFFGLTGSGLYQPITNVSALRAYYLTIVIVITLVIKKISNLEKRERLDEGYPEI